MMRTSFFRLYVGGYWASDGTYNGGVIRRCRVDFENPSVSMLAGMVQNEGFTENMSKFSYFPLGENQNRKELSGDVDVAEMIDGTHELESMNLFVVRTDDAYLENVLTGEEEEEEPEDEDEPINFYRDDYAETDDSDDDGQQVSFFVGQAFISKESCKKAIEKYAVKEKVNIRFQKSETKKVAAACVQDCCSWRIYASINSQSTNMIVRSYNGTHTCYPTGVVKLYSAPKIAADFLNEFRTNRDLSADQMMQRLLIQGLRVPKTKCQSARQIMLHIISDEYAEQFTRMFDYAEELRESNFGSTVILGTKDKVFEKFYTCFGAQKIGWKSSCRRVIHLDGTFLKGRMKGQLLTAVGRDPNDQMFIIAWAIVPVENKVNWEWFMTLLQEDLNLELGNGLALSSDQQKGLIYAIKTVLPYAEHRMCARHIWSNLRKRHGESGNLHDLFWKCARAYNMRVFERRLEKIKSVRPEAYEEVKRSVGSNWSRAFFNDFTKSAAVENNHSESYNAVLKDARRKPVVALLEDIRRHVMSSNLLKIKEIQNATGLITPKAKAVIEKRKKNLKWCHALSSGRGWYEVDHGTNKYRVYARGDVSCSCRAYDVSGIPCCHIMSAMWAEYGETKLPETVVSDWYSVEKWKLCYSSLLRPVNGMPLWKTHSDVVVMPPPDRIMPGRPKNNDRIRDPTEVLPSQVLSAHEKVQMTCSNCQQIGHNIRSCKREAVPKPPKQPKGRPRKKQKTMAEEDTTTQPTESSLVS